MKLLTLALLGLIVLLQHPLWLGKGSWLRVWEVDQQVRAQRDTNQKMTLRNAALDVEPDRHWINAYRLARKARHEQFGAVILLNHGAKAVRDLEPALIINFRRRVAPEHFYNSTSLHKNPLG